MTSHLAEPWSQPSIATSRSTSRRSFPIWVAATVTACAFGVSTYIARNYLLDDTFIHLRYARRLLTAGHLEYNAGQPSFGTSAYLYVLLLSLIGSSLSFDQWPAIAKCLSVAFHAVAVVLSFVAFNLHRAELRLEVLFKAGLVIFLLCVPSSTRWMQDGMETSLAVALTFGCGLVLLTWFRRAGRHPPLSPPEALLGGLWLSLPGLLRLDLLPISLVAAGALVLRDRRRYLLAATTCLILLSGWYLWVLQSVGQFQPDSALAKRTGLIEPLWFLGFFKSMLSVAPVWLAGPLLLLATMRRGRPWLLIVSGLLPLLGLIVAGSLLCQSIHGARYFLPHLAFTWCVAAAPLAAQLSDNQHTEIIAGSEVNSRALIGRSSLLLSVMHSALISPRLEAVFDTHEFALPAALNRPEVRLAAYDIGRLGWFSSATIMDLAGLVNGSGIAMSPAADRLCKLSQLMGFPDGFILTTSQAAHLANGDVLTLTCLDLSATYVDSGTVAMRMSKMDQPLIWRIWLPVETIPRGPL